MVQRPSIEDIRATFSELPVLKKKASRRWLVDLTMVLIGALVGTYAGNETVRTTTTAYAATVVKHRRAVPIAAPQQDAVSTHDTVILNAQRPLAPDLNRTASGEAPDLAPRSTTSLTSAVIANATGAKQQEPTKAKEPAHGRRVRIRK